MTFNFAVALRGYDRDRVEQLLSRADAALASSDPALRESARQTLLAPDLPVVLRGYACDQVDEAIRDRLRAAGPAAEQSDPAPPSFTVVLRGYDIGQVDEVFGRVRAALRSDDPVTRAAVRAALATATFRVRLRGYDRIQVDGTVREAVQRLT
ncbi:hypothetical protein [Actinoplanes sp. NPDC023714]|uniref:hypothetical protein n=1 Tax=Actinoplanes sp. NPDC023714 TaxID=3154322 RepID=UPI0033E25F07